MSSPGDAKPSGPKKNLLWIFAAVGLAGILYNNFFASSSDVKQERGQVPQAIEAGTNDINEITGQDKDAALVQFAKKLEAMTARLDRSERSREEDRKREESARLKQKQEAEANDRQLADAIAKLQTDLVDRTYEEINSIDTGAPSTPSVPSIQIPSGGLSFDGDFDLGSPFPSTSEQPATSTSPYGPNYTVLRPKNVNIDGANTPGAANSEPKLFGDISGPSTNSFTQAAARTDANMRNTLGRGNGTGAAAAVSPPVQTAEEIEQKRREDTVEINAFSFVEVTTLHGAACPIGANSPNSQSDGKPDARPIVLPARGVFKGPNGVVNDLGTIHLMGLCSGRRTSSSKTGRALIRIEQLSYWDAAGGPQMVPAVGYIVDMRDNEADVYGKLDKASGRTLALQSAAAAAAAYATTLSSAEFTNSSNVQNGVSSVTSQLTGSETKAAIAQGIGATFKEISDRFKAEADAARDAVLVEPGIKLRFVTELPIKVVKPLEPFDIDASMYDTLI
ncbi:conjugal transfer protein TraB [Stutzerimonas stutzeri]|uniref:Conjugal transfer protein TraB n=1 Tax=Stutzerimonas stutzeri TaxID=316 RepID=A0AA40RU85_STUST|nr:conjugal transfer protein TraB [Stutzerimonas stutzeri]MBA1305992.1 conjugal transfer protein TraB [Stutzerimonas stutzeri]